MWSIIRLFAVFAVLFAGCGRESQLPESRVILVGLDGIDLRIIDELVEAGRLPCFERILSEGLSGELRSYRPILSPLIWTTMATGRGPDEHRILGFSVHDDRVGATVVPSSRRRCAALWNIVPRYDRSTTVIGWWATWPAEETDGFLVSDRFGREFEEDLSSENKAAFPGVTYPSDLVEELTPLRVEATEVGYEELSRYVDMSREAYEREMDASLDVQNPLHHLRLIVGRAETYRNVLLHMLERHPTDLTMVYFAFTDSISHLFMPARPPKQPQISQAEFDRYSGAVDAAYEHADEILSDVMERLRPADMLIVVSDHGFLSGDDRPRVSSETTTETAALWHRLEGTILAYRPGAEKTEIRNATVYDIMPTLLSLYGIPASLEMLGRALPEIQETAGLVPGPVNRVGDLDGDYQPAELPEAELADSKEIERLRALGYVGGESAVSDVAFEIAERFNLAVFLDENGSSQEALNELNRVIELDPSHEKALGRKSKVLVELGRLEEAETLLENLIAVHEKRLDAIQQGSTGNSEQDAEGTNRKSEEGIVEWRLAGLLHQKGVLHFKRREFARALRSFQRSVELDPDNLETLYNLGILNGIAGRYGEAEEILTRFLEANPRHSKARHGLAVALIRQGSGDRARPYLFSLIEEMPGDANLLYLVGESYRVNGDFPESLEWYRKALDADPELQKAKDRIKQLGTR